MHSKKLISWLKKEKLYDTAKEHSIFLKKVFKYYLKVNDEGILIIGDWGSFNKNLAPLMTASYHMAAKELKHETFVVVQKPKNKGDFASKNVVEALKALPDNNIVIANVSNRIGKLKGFTKSFRATMRLKGHRFCSLGGLGSLENSYFPVIVKAIKADNRVMHKKANTLKQLMDKSDEIHVTSKAGTDIKIDIKDAESVFNTGYFRTPGSGGNMPCGEIYIPPKSANGTIVIDGSIRHAKGTELIKEPVVIKVRGGKVTSIKGKVEADLLCESLEEAEERAKRPENIRILAEFAIGLNPKTEIIGQTAIDEKTLGTCHVAIGSNAWFGGDNKTIIHLDQVFKEPSVKIDNRRVMSKGKLLI